MSFSNRLIRTPRPFDETLGKDALLHVPQCDGAMAELIVGAAGCSPFKWVDAARG